MAERLHLGLKGPDLVPIDDLLRSVFKERLVLVVEREFPRLKPKTQQQNLHSWGDFFKLVVEHLGFVTSSATLSCAGM